MSVLKAYFGSSVNYVSPIKEDYDRIVNYDEDGNEYITYEKVDYSKIIERNGVVDDWSLSSLLKAGINPKFGIHTGLNTRLEGFGAIQDASAAADSLLSETPNAE